MFAHNGYWLHPAHCQLFSVHVTRFSELKNTGFFSTRQSFGSEKGSLNERMRQIVSSGPCGTGFVVPFDGIETNKTLTDNNTL